MRLGLDVPVVSAATAAGEDRTSDVGGGSVGLLITGSGAEGDLKKETGAEGGGGKESSLRCVTTGRAVTYGGVLKLGGGPRNGLPFPSRKTFASLSLSISISQHHHACGTVPSTCGEMRDNYIIKFPGSSSHFST